MREDPRNALIRTPRAAPAERTPQPLAIGIARRADPPGLTTERSARRGFSRPLWWLSLGLSAAVGLLAGGLVGAPGAAERAALSALARIEDRLGVRVSAGGVAWTWGGRVVASEVLVTTREGELLATIARLDASLDVALLERSARLVSLAIERPSLALVRHPDGTTNLDALIAALGRARTGTGASPGGRLDLSGVELSVNDVHVSMVPSAAALPLELELPERVELRKGRLTTAETPGGRTITLAFADTSLDPGQPFEVALTLSETGWLGPAIGSLGRLERISVRPARPVRFWIGDRVVGAGGVALGRDGLELLALQLSVPVDRRQPDGRVAAAATLERLTLALSDPESLLGADALADLGRRLRATLSSASAPSTSGATKPLLARLTLQRPVLSVSIDAEGRHSFSDLEGLLTRFVAPRGPTRAAGFASAANGGPDLLRSAPPSDSATLLIRANLSAADRLLTSRPPPRASWKQPTAAPLVAAVRDPLRAATTLLETASDQLTRLGPPLALLSALTDELRVDEGELVLTVAADARSASAKAAPALPLSLERIALGVTPTRTSASAPGSTRLTLSFDNPWSPGHPVALTLVPPPGPTKPSTTFSLDASHLPMAALGPLAARLHLGSSGTLSRLSLEGELAPDRLEVRFSLVLADLTFQHASVARDPLRDLDLTLEGLVRFDPRAETLLVEDLAITARGLRLTGSLELASALTAPRVRLSLTLPETPIAEVIAAIPEALIPMLRGLTMQGRLGWDLTVDLDTANPSALRIDSRPRPHQLRVTNLGERLDFQALRGSHAYTIRLFDGSPGTRVVGPATASWVPLANITPYLPLALTTTEDATFYTNDGISTFAMRESIATNIERGAFARGASTITQQLVKNLYLGGEKTLSRKLQEIFIAWQMAQHLSKDEIMALYLNTIEFGPGLYGIGDAAWHWFGKRPIDLTLTESVFLASIIPGPRRYYTFFEQGGVTPRWRAYLESLLRVMVERKKITTEELAEALPAEPRFRSAGGGYADEVPADFDALPERDDFGEHVDEE